MTSRRTGVIGRFTGRRTRALAAGSALIIAGAAGTMATVTNAQQPTPTPTPRAATAQASPTPGAGSQQRAQAMTDYINRLAQNLGITPDRLRAALQQTALQQVDAALARGEITAQQAQQARDRINAGEVGFGPGFGRPGHGGPGRGFFVPFDQLAQFLGVTEEQLRTELNGRSLAQVAQSHGRTREQLIQFLVTATQQRIAADVQAGRITQAEADTRLADLRTRIEQKVDEVRQLGERPRPGTGAP